jgi:hypothetical protein
MPPRVRALARSKQAQEDQKVALATRDGNVVLATLSADSPDVSLRDNPELWRLLRNGCVVGMVQLQGESGPVPLVNLAALGASYEPSTERAQLTGMWDFKWPRGATIKVRIDKPETEGLTSDQREASVALARTLAQQWLPHVDKQKNPGELTFEFVEGGDDYDVLVNLDPLENNLPVSDLGTYSQRRPLGDPTMYVGRPLGIKEVENGAALTPAEFFVSDAFKHIVSHEFGHALGLPHLHQHPAWGGAAFKPDVNGFSLQSAIKERMGISVDAEFISEHLRSAWPGDARAYSDWPDVSHTLQDGKIIPKALVPYADESVMMGMPVRGLLQGDGEPRLNYKVGPRPYDREWLAELYKPGAQQRHR